MLSVIAARSVAHHVGAMKVFWPGGGEPEHSFSRTLLLGICASHCGDGRLAWKHRAMQLRMAVLVRTSLTRFYRCSHGLCDLSVASGSQ